jgi:hypothetical protein
MNRGYRSRPVDMVHVAQPEPDPASFLGSSDFPSVDLSSGLFGCSVLVWLELSPGFVCVSPELRWAGWFVKLCQIDFRNPSFLCVAGSSSFVAAWGPEDEDVVSDLQ